MCVTLVLADDHPMVLNGLTALFRMEEDFKVIASCTDGADALEAIRLHRPDVAVLDVAMPRVSGLEAARQIIEGDLPTRVVLFTAGMEEEQTLEALHLGVHGLLLKELPPHVLVECIQKVHAGEQWVAHSSAMKVLDKILRREDAAREFAALLTARELEIVLTVTRGLRNKEIADLLGVSEGTVKVHLHNIYDKLKVHGRTALLRYAQEKGLL